MNSSEQRVHREEVKELGAALLRVTSDFGYKTLHRYRARNAKQSWFSSRERSPFKNSTHNKNLFATQHSYYILVQ